jgi:hypothetical protein
LEALVFAATCFLWLTNRMALPDLASFIWRAFAV